MTDTQLLVCEGLVKQVFATHYILSGPGLVVWLRLRCSKQELSYENKL